MGEAARGVAPISGNVNRAQKGCEVEEKSIRRLGNTRLVLAVGMIVEADRGSTFAVCATAPSAASLETFAICFSHRSNDWIADAPVDADKGECNGAPDGKSSTSCRIAATSATSTVARNEEAE